MVIFVCNMSIFNCTHIAWDPGWTPGAHLTLYEWKKKSHRERLYPHPVSMLMISLTTSCPQETITDMCETNTCSKTALWKPVVFISQMPLSRGDL